MRPWQEPVAPVAPPDLVWVSQRHLRLGTCDFHCEYPLGAVPEGRLPLMKPPLAVEDYAALAGEGRRPLIVELGIHSGGSTAMLRELFQPDRLVAVELSASPVAALAAYIAEHELEGVVRPQYGVDQADRARVTAILDDEFGDEAVDLVVDDASHRYEETVASLEVLLPRLRPGGLYIIEDWTWEHLLSIAMQAARAEGGEAAAKVAASVRSEMAERAASGGLRTTPLSQLVIELVLACASGDVVAGLTIGSSSVVLERGPATLDPVTFRLGDLYDDPFGQVVR